MDQLSTRQKIAIAIAVPASLGLLYLLFRKKEEEYEGKPHRSGQVTVKEQMTLQMQIPHDRVGAVIGRDGVSIKKIRHESGARLNFQDDANLKKEESRTLVLSGRPGSVVKAEQLIQEILNAPPLQTVDMLIPTKAVGRVIGKGGANIRTICRASGARVRVPRREDQTNQEAYRLCFIKGTPEEISVAKALIQDAIKAEEDFEKRLDDAAANRKQRSQRKSEETDQNEFVVTQPEQVRCPSHGDFFTVYVSAVEHANHFWIQIITDKSKELDLLVQNMTEYYSQKRNQEVHSPDTLCTGDLYAAPFPFDNNWYRGRIEGFLENGNVDVYFVDYGDYGSVPRDNVFTLRADFLSLPFQAVECCIDGIEPTGDKWSEESTDLFEELTYNAQWRPLMARITGYQRTQAGATLPSVQLVDTSSDTDKDIASELVKRGFAKDKRHASSDIEVAPRSPTKSSSPQLSPETSES